MIKEVVTDLCGTYVCDLDLKTVTHLVRLTPPMGLLMQLKQSAQWVESQLCPSNE